MNEKHKITVADTSFSKKDREFIMDGVDKILSGQLSMGENVRLFENEFSEMTGSRYSVAMNSCTSTLEVALKSFDVGKGDEVIVPIQTFIATGMAVHLVGAKPIFCNINKKDFCLDLKSIENCITKRTKGIILVHFAGLISEDIFKIQELCKSHNIFMIEDAAHAPGAEIDNKRSGTIGDVGCFSFFPTKVLTAGEGGMFTTDNNDLADYARSQQNRGRDLKAEREEYKYPGRNIRMTEMTALTGRAQLRNLEKYLASRRKIANIYKRGFDKLQSKIEYVAPKDDRNSSYWKFPIILNRSFDRDIFLAKLHSKGIFADLTYQPSLNNQPVFKNIFESKKNLQNSESLMKRHICLPCHQNMTEEQGNFVVSTVIETCMSFEE